MSDNISRTALLYALIGFGVVSLVLYADMHHATTPKEIFDAAMRDDMVSKIGLLMLMQPIVFGAAFGLFFLLKKRSNHDSG